MAKFTIFFKDKAIQSYIFDSGIIRIGRDESNDLVIDNPIVAPAHAVVTIDEGSCIIKQLSDEAPLIINNEKTKEAFLQNNDAISVGKHSIVFSTTESIAPKSFVSNKDVESLNQKLEAAINLPNANFQILDGQHIGRILPIKKSMTKIGHPGTGVIIISKRKDGFYISSLETDAKIYINQALLADRTVHLSSDDIVIINNISMQFFIGTQL